MSTDNYDAMKEQQARYALGSDDFVEMMASIADLKRNVESMYSEMCIPPEAKVENVAYVTEIIVRFAFSLNSFHEAIRCAHKKGFDLSAMIMLSSNHSVYVVQFKMLSTLVDALQRAARWIHNKMCGQQ